MERLAHAVIHLPGGKTIQKGILVHSRGKIVYCGEDKKIPGIKKEIKLPAGVHITAGLIDCHTHLGLHEEKVESAGDDTNEISSPITAEVRAIDGINPFDPGFEYARASGITSVNVLPGSANPVGGLGVSIKTAGTIIDNMVLLNPSSIKMALGQNPKRTHGSMKKAPMTRMATASVIRQALYDALDYKSRKRKDKNLKTDLKMESLLLLLSGKIPARIHCHRTDDIATALRIAREFKFKFVIDHATEGHIIPDTLRNLPVVVGPTLTARYKDEVKNRTFCTPSVLYKHSLLAMTTDHPVVPQHQLITTVMLAVKAGLPKEYALDTITVNAAEIIMLGKRIGKLAKGMDADFAVWSEDPLSMNAHVLYTYIDGTLVYEHQKAPSPYHP